MKTPHPKPLVRFALISFFALSCGTSWAQSPSSIGGRTIQLSISSGTSPFSTFGSYRFLPSALDATYAIVPLSGNTDPSTGTHTYSKTGANTASLFLSDSSGLLVTVICNFSTASSGTYTASSNFGGSQSGSFIVYSGASPASLAGYTITVSITSGTTPFASSGSYEYRPAASGNTYNVLGLSGVANSSGTYSYTQNSATTGYLSYDDSLAGAGHTSQMSFNSSTTGTLFLRKSGSSSYQTGTFTMIPPSPPNVSNPQNKTNLVGTSVTFSVSASGVGTLSYQWRKNGSNIDGATGSSYTINPVLASSAGDYSVVVSNVGGSTPSGAATLTVHLIATVGASLATPAWSQVNGFTFGVTVQTGTSYRVQYSTDLINWLVLTSFATNITSVQIRDSTATSQTRRYYRVVSP